MMHHEFIAAFKAVTGSDSRTDAPFLSAVQAAYRSEDYDAFLTRGTDAHLSNHRRFATWLTCSSEGRVVIERELAASLGVHRTKVDRLARLQLEVTTLRMELGLDAAMPLRDFRTESLRNELERRELTDMRQVGAR